MGVKKAAKGSEELNALTKSVQQAVSVQDYPPITSIELRDEATRAVLHLKTLKKRIEEYWAGPKKSAYNVWKEVGAKESEMLEPVSQRIKFIGKRIDDFLTEQERVRRERQAELDRERQAEIAKQEQALRKKLEKAVASGKETKIDQIQDEIAQIDRTPEIVTVEKGVSLDEGQLSAVRDVEVSVQDVYSFLAEILAKRAPIGCIEFKLKPLKDFVRLNQLQSFPGLAIREVQKARIRAN